MKTSKKTLLICLLLLILISAYTFVYAKNFLSILPFPIRESEEIISVWFKDKGFELSRASLRGDSIKLMASKKDESWQIILKPRSPLATEIIPQYSNNNHLKKAETEELLIYLRYYSEGVYKQEEDQKQIIPSSVVSQQKHSVCIHAIKNKMNIQFSGCIIDEEGLIISTAHDLQDGENVQVIMSNGQQFDGRLVTVDHHRDLSLIRVNKKFISSISLDNARRILSKGEWVYSIDCPINHKESILAGVVSGPPRLSDDLPLWQVKMRVLQGDSGSPVFDSMGNFIGLVKGRYRGTDSVGFIIPFDIIIEFLRNIKLQ